MTPSATNPWIASLKTFASSWKDERLKTLRSIGEFFDRSKLSLPSIKDIPARIKSNLAHFQTNYLLVFLLLSIYSALTTPIFLVTLIVVSAIWFYALKYKDSPVVLFGFRISEKIIAFVLVILTLVVFYMSSAGTVLWWLLLTSVLFVFAHAFFYTPAPVDEFGFGLPTDSTTNNNINNIPPV